MKQKLLALGIALAGVFGNSLSANAADFEVTITNLTRGQQFTPILVASHKAGVQLFKLGQSASPELATLAEEGNTEPLTNLLTATPGVLDVTKSSGLLNPGASVTVKVKTRGDFNRLSVASMLIPTNDAFFALNGVKGPWNHEVASYSLPSTTMRSSGIPFTTHFFLKESS